MNLEYMKVSLFEISYKKNLLFHDIQIVWDAPVLRLEHAEAITTACTTYTKCFAFDKMPLSTIGIQN